MQRTISHTNLLAIGVFLGLTVLGYLLGNAAIRVKEYERTVTVKGLSEREVPADVVIWPIAFTAAANDLGQLYLDLERSAHQVRSHLVSVGIEENEVSVSPPAVTDKSAQQWVGGERAEFRYTATQVVTVYSGSIGKVREAMEDLVELGKQGIVFTANSHQHMTEYQFNGLNEIKPAMIEEATVNARAVAEKFARDSGSKVGRIRQASQGQFSITDRDRNNPHIKNVRVVSTIEYYLAD
jgi:hypothetical protein